MEKGKEPASKRRRLSLSLKGQHRFCTASNDAIEELSKPSVPKNTATVTRWAVKNITEWFHDYNQRNKESPCPEEFLSATCSPPILNQWLRVFTTETRAKNGENYPPKTLYALLTGFLRHMRGQNPSYPNFLARKDPMFSEFTALLDNLFKSLRASGVGANSKHTEPITTSDEDLLWETETLNIDTPLGLLRYVFFYNGKCFCLRGCQEHRDLQLSQLERSKNPDKYVYSENSSKNRKGGLSELRLEHKSVTIVANPSAGCRCHVFLLDLYISKLPKAAIEKDIFYCQPLPSKPRDSTHPWFAAVPVGRNQLAKMVPDMCSDAGVPGHKTNHSLRVAGASSLFDAGVPERIIQARTGHRSLDALRLYERVTDKQNLQVSKILSGEKEIFEEGPSNSKQEETSSKVTSASCQPATQYNNCTVNVYSFAMPQMCFPPVPDPYAALYYPPMPHGSHFGNEPAGEQS